MTCTRSGSTSSRRSSAPRSGRLVYQVVRGEQTQPGEVAVTRKARKGRRREQARRRDHRHPREPLALEATSSDRLLASMPSTAAATWSVRPTPERGLRADRGARDPDDLRQLRLRDRPRPRRLRLRLCRPARPRPRSTVGRLDAGAHRAAPRTSCASLPFDLRFALGGKRVRLVHGSPRKVNEYLFEDKPARTFERIAALPTRHARLRPHPQALGARDRGGPFINAAASASPRMATPAALSRCSMPIERRSRGDDTAGRLRRRLSAGARDASGRAARRAGGQARARLPDQSQIGVHAAVASPGRVSLGDSVELA